MSDTPRWRVIVRYFTDAGEIDVEYHMEELDELGELIERGPNWYTIKGIVITHIRKPEETMTIERSLAE
jgi:hypothetical protein